MSQSNLCQLPLDPTDACCDAAPPPPAAPLAINNPPGLSAIAYRIGTFTSFRRAMLDGIAGFSQPETSPPGSGPFANWREGAEGDYQTIFIELWAYLADILTFYQERIANEAYIGTATQNDSARRLAKLIGYLPAPGSGASELIAFNAAKGKTAAVPQGFRVGSRAQPGRPAAVFETSSPLTARAEHNAIPLSAVAPTNQFAQLSSIARLFYDRGPPTLDLARELYDGAGQTLFRTLPTLNSSASQASQTARTIVLKGASNRLSFGDYVLAVENEHSSGEKATLYQLSSVSVNKAANTTAISWQENAGTKYQQSAANPVALYVLRVHAAPFASNAPNWNTLSPTLTTPSSPPAAASPPYPINWDDGASDLSFMPPRGIIALDGLYDAAKATADNPGWVVLASDSGGLGKQILRFIGAQPVVLTDYALNARVTQLALVPNKKVSNRTFGIRNTLILTGAEKLSLQNNLPLPDPAQGATLILAGLYPNLQDGQVAIVSGSLFDPSGTGTAGAAATEIVRLVGPPLLDNDNGLATIQLKDALRNQYVRATTVLLANIVAVTQGETVGDEVLGSGDGSALQSYPLKKKPLTYLPSTHPQGVSAVESTLTVTVNGMQWREQENLFESGPAAQDFLVTRDDSGTSSVIFGNGVNGMCPPSGMNNIHARYRVGMGSAGNVPPGGVQQLITNLAGLQQATNSQATAGGADPESLADIRRNAPASLRAFNRAVSADDYATLALTFPGIAKASARRVLFDANRLALAHPYIQLTAAATDGSPVFQGNLASQLRSFLDQRRDPNISLRILDFTPVYVDIAVTINLDPRVPRQATFARVQAALNPGRNPDGTAGYFAFDTLNFGQSLHLSVLYAFIQNIFGVRSVTVTRFRRMDLDGDDATVVRDDILIGPTEIAVVGNVANQPKRGLLTIVQGEGGFIDT